MTASTPVPDEGELQLGPVRLPAGRLLQDAALPVAAEHWVFSDEPAGRQPVQTTAAEIVDAPVWYFWWD
jgi:Domain of unknown function (DUF4253)